MVIEIASDSTRRIDRLTKLNLYQRAEVKEYWIVDPDTHIVSVHMLENGVYRTAGVYSSGIMPVNILPGCKIDLSTVFPDE